MFIHPLIHSHLILSIYSICLILLVTNDQNFERCTLSLPPHSFQDHREEVNRQWLYHVMKAITEEGGGAMEAEIRDFSSLILFTGYGTFQEISYSSSFMWNIWDHQRIKKPSSSSESRKGPNRKSIFTEASTIPFISLDVTPS